MKKRNRLFMFNSKSSKVIIFSSFLVCVILSTISCNNISNNLLKETSVLSIKINWEIFERNMRNYKIIPDSTDYIILTLNSLELENYIKSIQIEKNDSSLKTIKLYPGNYNIGVFAISKETSGEKINYNLLNCFSNSFEISPNENKVINSDLISFNIEPSVSDLSNFKIGDTFYYYLTIPDTIDYLDIYSFYYILDFNKNNNNSSDNIKKIRVKKENIEKINQNNKITFKIKCDTDIEDFLDISAKLGFKVEFRMDKNYFSDNFFIDNNIYKIYHYYELNYFTDIQDHQTQGNLEINIQ